MAHLNYIFNLSRFSKRIISLIVDAIFVIVSFYSAYWARVSALPPLGSQSFQLITLGVLFITLVVFAKLGLYRAVLRYLTFHALAVVSLGTLISALSISVFAFFLDASLPRSVPVIYGSFLCILCGGQG